jgi:hypothetical protein
LVAAEAMTREEIEQKMDELARQYVEAHNQEIIKRALPIEPPASGDGKAVKGRPVFLFSKR